MQARNTIFTDPVTIPPKVWTEGDLERLESETGKRYELVAGIPREKGPKGMEHSYIAANLTGEMRAFVKSQRLGIVLESSAAYRMTIGNLRKPDVSFVAKSRLSEKRLSPKPFEGAPDLAVEVISPTDIWWEILEKLNEYFSSGCRLVWLISPLDQTVMVYHPDRRRQFLQIGDSLDGEDVIPGFTMPVADLFAELNFD
ncbi:MAG TPA: Uma2 family endonuclease [Blastocatellia bacterium]|nr:Uma2 family endonuclease [Blastocatellia bacterium]